MSACRAVIGANATYCERLKGGGVAPGLLTAFFGFFTFLFFGLLSPISGLRS